MSDSPNDSAELLDDEEVGVKEVKYRHRNFGKFRCLLVVAIVLFLACVALAVLFTLEKLKTTPAQPHQPKPTSQPKICDTVDCVYEAERKLLLVYRRRNEWRLQFDVILDLHMACNLFHFTLIWSRLLRINNLPFSNNVYGFPEFLVSKNLCKLSELRYLQPTWTSSRQQHMVDKVTLKKSKLN